MTVVGGTRARLIRDSFYHYIHDGVVARGWTSTNRRHKPFEFIPQPKDWDEEVPLNSIAITAEDVRDEEAEMGSALTEDTWTFYVDVYAEGDAVGTDITHDIRDMLRGKMQADGYGRTAFPVWDYRLATPVIIFTCDIENVVSDRARNFPQAWRRFWFSIRCDVVDNYATDLDEEDELGVPTDFWDSGGPGTGGAPGMDIIDAGGPGDGQDD